MTDLNRWATWREIHAQPAIWADWAARLPVDDLRRWVRAQGAEQIWFCGAGSSAYVGEIVTAALEGYGWPLRAVATTDLVQRPQVYLRGRPLVVSFGRSGNSAETLGTLDALDALLPDAPRLNITCNPDGALARRGGAPGTGPLGPIPGAAPGIAPSGAVPGAGPGAGPGAVRALVLPEATHDQGFAMTSSFTTMLLSALAIFDPAGAGGLPGLARALEQALPAYRAAAAAPVPARIVFVGAGPLAFAARECALKVMELTAGQVPALWDSTLGFRHGPKSFVTEGTQIVVLVHPHPDAARYDHDLIAELRAQFPGNAVTSLGPGGDIALPGDWGAGWMAALMVPLAQVLAVVWSDRLGLNVDDPFAGRGTLSRVVAGVKLYPVAR